MFYFHEKFWPHGVASTSSQRRVTLLHLTSHVTNMTLFWRFPFLYTCIMLNLIHPKHGVNNFNLWKSLETFEFWYELVWPYYFLKRICFHSFPVNLISCGGPTLPLGPWIELNWICIPIYNFDPVLSPHPTSGATICTNLNLYYPGMLA